MCELVPEEPTPLSFPLQGAIQRILGEGTNSPSHPHHGEETQQRPQQPRDTQDTRSSPTCPHSTILHGDGLLNFSLHPKTNHLRHAHCFGSHGRCYILPSEPYQSPPSSVGEVNVPLRLVHLHVWNLRVSLSMWPPTKCEPCLWQEHWHEWPPGVLLPPGHYHFRRPSCSSRRVQFLPE